MHLSLRLIPAAVAVLLLASCGGGGGTAPNPNPPPVSSSSGVAVDGYLKFATVLCDSNGNGLVDAGEREAGTSAAGQFSFAPECESGLVVRGGTNADTGLPFTGQLRAPAGAKVVSPLTTLLAAGATQAELDAALDLDAGTDLLNTDPALTQNGDLVHPALFRKTLAMQQLIQKAAELFAALAGQTSADAVRALYATVAASFAGQLGAAAPLIDGSTMDPAVVAGLVAAATKDAKALFAFLDPVNAAALGEVTGGAMAAQAEAVLNASAFELTGAIKAAQASTQITDFVIANVGQLNTPPNETTAALGATLTDLVDPYLALADDSISLVLGSAVTTYTMTQFESDAGISVSWPLPEPLMLELTLAHAENFAPVPGQKVSAAVSITETAAGGKGTILAYIDDVDVQRTASAVVLSVPTTSAAKVYGVSSDGKKKAVINFQASVAHVTGTFNVGPGVPTSLPLGNIVNYAINQLSNDFTGILGLRGKYRVSIVVSGLSLRRADGSLLTPNSITVPTSLDASGGVAASHTVEGRGLQGYISLVD
ncbi:MAG: hypothetical protein OEW22_12665 [Rubrivivax sp.]|nr:hypothetical protein [Rubrivivax sp.]